MRATKPGMIVGYALEDSAVTSTIQTFVNVSYYAGGTLKTDGTIAFLDDDLVVNTSAEASASVPLVNSFGLTFRGKAWDSASSTAVTHEFTLLNNVISATSSALSVLNTNHEAIFSLSQQGDLSMAGKLFPSFKGGGAQTDWYMFVDDTLGASSTYLSTNAAGWQSLDTYDFAERYYSPDALKPGDLVAMKQGGGPHVQRSLDENQTVLGIVSTQPAFIAGRPGPDTFPIALSGRVPTHVSTMNGEIHAGDPLGPSSIPGIAIKRVTNGPMVGTALEDYSSNSVGKIEVYVNPGWWGGSTEAASAPASVPQTNTQGFAQIISGQTQVHVHFDSINAYPNVQVTKQAQVDGDWWTTNYSDTGFDIILAQAQQRDVVFSWSVTPSTLGTVLYLSDGTYSTIDPTSGQAAITTVPPPEEPVTEPASSVTNISTAVITTTTAVDISPAMTTSTEPVVSSSTISNTSATGTSG